MVPTKVGAHAHFVTMSSSMIEVGPEASELDLSTNIYFRVPVGAITDPTSLRQGRQGVLRRRGQLRGRLVVRREYLGGDEDDRG